MTRRRWITWIVFGLCALLVVDVLGWATWRVLRLERAERLATARADAGRRERLALWQMDSLVSAVVARESARPYFVYRPRFAADRPYDRAWDLEQSARVLASPLAAGTGDPLIRLHYQIESDSRIISPQSGGLFADTGWALGLDLGADAPDTLRSRRLLREFETMLGSRPAPAPGQPIATVADKIEPERPADPLASTQERVGDALQLGQPSELAEADSGPALGRAADAAQAEPEPGDARLRQQLFEIARQNFDFQTTPGPVSTIVVGPFQPRWIGDRSGAEGAAEPELVFERTITVDGLDHTQGFWIDWPSLRAELLAAAVRLVPNATLEPVTEPTGSNLGVLATIPLRLVSPDPATLTAPASPARFTLIVTWIATLVALVAIGVVLRAATRLADRRGRFVATITHELRTPLTTFRLYTDLLRAAGDDPAARAKYTDALSRESDRLVSVVENVLAYAGLTKRRAPAEPARLGDLLEPLLPALTERTEHAEGRLHAEIDDGAADAIVRIDAPAFERVLTNLIDNACRYGLSPERPVVTLGAARAANAVRLRVSDEGPGVRARDRDRIFSAFVRGDQPRDDRGVGLGLTLARGLARSAGGELRLVDSDGPGAAFEFRLPIVCPSDGGAG